ncbi:hypothetical protein CPB83DRAFT_879575 [Crepidotus variabilis]|uniref:Actin cytoskeleton-regulatory complex protein SLA1 n=1 Tax=Crepidotus variabilis TaxID=179855 RepID=A0A9P6ET61_9AGAR|nr:hypothetical protein CPB83DRAFT_879575 [Crepidotus variabilis]
MASEEPENYLAVLKAAYDYEPQSEDEIAIKQDQLLLLVEKVDEDWWRVKIKGSTQDTDSQIGLVPAAYVEQAEHNSVVKALYDYEAAAPGELSVNEADVLLVFETEEDWILVQDKNSEKAGYVPGNYVEVFDADESPESAATSRIVVPDSPPKPAYVDPGERVASAKVTADDIKTWSVSELDKKGKKKKGTLGVGNGSVFFASESDKTPVQKWQTKDVASVTSEKAKHVEIEIGGSNPVTLHFHAGTKDNAEAIIEKLHSSKALTSTPTEQHEPEQLEPQQVATKKASVHFSPAAPTIIPDPEVAEEEEEPEPEHDGEDVATALYDFTADGDDELSVTKDERLTILERDGEEWWKCRNSKGQEGVVPASYLEAATGSGNIMNGHAVATKDDDEDDEQARLADEHRRQQEEEERRQQEAEEAERRKTEDAAKARKAEAQRKAKEAADAAGAERKARQKKKEAAAARATSPPAQPTRADPPRMSSSSREDSRQSSDVNRPAPEQTRVWHDRTGQFRVEATFLGFKDGKLRLHKVNGVIVEVPSEKMSAEDMRYVEKVTEKKRSTAHAISDDDIPLAIAKSAQKSQPPQKKKPQIDWFDFFLSAGCDLDDCTRYAASFERDKMDETLLPDITEGTMRSLGLKEGDILRVKKAIDKRRPTDNLSKQSSHLQDQLKKDEELALQLQAQENSGRGSAPNLFAGPGGALKAPRRGRPQPSKTLPPANVDLSAISTASGHIQRTESPRPSSAQHTSSSMTLPVRPSSAAASSTISGFDDDAWTNRPSSTKPVKTVSPPPALAPPPVTAPAPASIQPAPAVVPVSTSNGTPSLANTTENDIMSQLARLSELRKNSTPQQQPQPAPSPSIITPPVSFQAGMGMGPSPSPIGQLANSRIVSPPPQQPYNGPRGPFAPVPANQGLLQPLIPTQTGFSGFVPTKPIMNNSPSPFQNQMSTPGFMHAQPTGFQTPSPIMMQPTGAYGGGPFAGGVPAFNGQNGNFGSMSTLPMQPQVTGFSMMNQMNPSPFANPGGMSSPPPLPSNQVKDNSPANVFAQMKSGTFGNDDNQNNGQSGWGQQQQYSGYTGY